MPKGVEEGIIRGIYKLSSKDAGSKKPVVQLFSAGAIVREALRAQEILAEQFEVSSNVWSVTSFTEVAREANATERHNMLHPTAKPRTSYLRTLLDGEPGPIVCASDYVRALADQLGPCLPGRRLLALGTDGFGRSETRARLRRHFEVDAESIATSALYELSQQGQIEARCVAAAIKKLGIDPDKIDPIRA
jgi:pyruvate dehydrogenase E1 component